MEHKVLWEKEFGAEPVVLLEPTPARLEQKRADTAARLKAAGVPAEAIAAALADVVAVSRDDAEEYARTYKITAGGKTTVVPVPVIAAEAP